MYLVVTDFYINHLLEFLKIIQNNDQISYWIALMGQKLVLKEGMFQCNSFLNKMVS